MEASRVVVAIADPALARVLVLWLTDAMPERTVIAADGGPLPGDIVLVTPTDCDPVAVAELVERGMYPIVLTPIPRKDELERYASAGAAYVVMSIDSNRALERAILAAPGSHSPAIAFPAASSQALSPKRSA